MADLHNYITPFVIALGNTIAKRLPRGGGYKAVIVVVAVAVSAVVVIVVVRFYIVDCCLL